MEDSRPLLHDSSLLVIESEDSSKDRLTNQVEMIDNVNTEIQAVQHQITYTIDNAELDINEEKVSELEDALSDFLKLPSLDTFNVESFDLAHFYTREISFILNTSGMEMYEKLVELCLPDLQVFFYVYKISSKRTKPKPVAKCIDIQGINAFYFFWENVLDIIPDAVSLLKKPRYCDTETDTWVFICFFECLGHSLIPDYKLYKVPSPITTYKEGISVFPSKSSGSLAICINSNGSIVRMEFYLQQK